MGLITAERGAAEECLHAWQLARGSPFTAAWAVRAHRRSPVTHREQGPKQGEPNAYWSPRKQVQADKNTGTSRYPGLAGNSGLTGALFISKAAAHGAFVKLGLMAWLWAEQGC